MKYVVSQTELQRWVVLVDMDTSITLFAQCVDRNEAYAKAQEITSMGYSGVHVCKLETRFELVVLR